MVIIWNCVRTLILLVFKKYFEPYSCTRLLYLQQKNLLDKLEVFRIDEKVIFRTATLLYADTTTYDINRDKITYKIVESVLVNQHNNPKSVDEIIILLRDYYQLNYNSDEIERIILSYPSNLNLKYDRNRIISIQLTEKRYSLLQERLKHNDIDVFIDEFVSAFNYNLKVKELIYKFLHHVLSTNTRNFHHLLETTIETEKLLQSENDFRDEEVRIINRFLQYDSPMKNQAIYNIVCYSLEYCMLTGDGKTVYEHGLKNKELYLDTNILFRAIGIHGELRKARIISFLERCISTDEVLSISKYTEEEFKNTIKSKINYEIGRFSRNYDSRMYYRYTQDQDMMLYYLNWKSERQNSGLDSFESFIYSQYQSLLKKFSIRMNYNILGDKWKKEIDFLAEKIESFKCKTDRSKTDAKNLLLIKELRNKTNSTQNKVMETKHFMISTDGKLMDFSINNFKNETVLCMRPSYWHTILLRYSKRTDDDFKSFVSFLQLQNHEKTITGDKVQAVLSGISEITSDIQKIEFFSDEIISKKVNQIIELDDLDKIHQEAMEYAESQISLELQEQKIEIIELNDKLETFQTTLKSKIEFETTLSNELENERLKNNKLFEKRVEDKIKIWRSIGVAKGVIIATVILIWFINIMFFPSVLFGRLDAWVKDSTSPFITDAFNVVLSFILYYPFRLIKSRFKNGVIDAKRKEIRESLQQESQIVSRRQAPSQKKF